MFSCEFCEISKNLFAENTSGGCFWALYSWLLFFINESKKKLVSTKSECYWTWYSWLVTLLVSQMKIDGDLLYNYQENWVIKRCCKRNKRKKYQVFLYLKPMPYGVSTNGLQSIICKLLFSCEIVHSLFFRRFLLVLPNFSFREEDWALNNHSIKFLDFLDFS